MNRPPADYADLNAEEGFLDLTQLAHKSAAANVFYLTVSVHAIPVSLFGL